MKTGLMTKLFAGLVVVLVAVVAAQFASSATSTSSKSIPARVKALEAKMRSLSASVKTLKGQVATLEARSACLAAQGLTQWGNPAASQGYVYTNDGSTFVITTALDFPAQGQTPTFFAASINPSCVGTRRDSFKPTRVASHRMARLERP